MLITRAGTVDVTLFFVDDPGGVAIVNVNVAGTPALPMGSGTVAHAPDASGPTKRR